MEGGHQVQDLTVRHPIWSYVEFSKKKTPRQEFECIETFEMDPGHNRRSVREGDREGKRRKPTKRVMEQTSAVGNQGSSPLRQSEGD